MKLKIQYLLSLLNKNIESKKLSKNKQGLLLNTYILQQIFISLIQFLRNKDNFELI